MKEMRIFSFLTLVLVLAVPVSAQTLSIRQENLRYLKEFDDRIVHDSFRVSKTASHGRYSREQLIKLFDLWRHQYASDGATSTFQIPEHSVKLLKTSVFQVAGSGIYLIGSVDSLSAFKSRGDRTWVDGSRVVAYAIPDGTFSYTTVLGANKTIRKWKELALDLSEDNGLSTEDFTKLLRDGNEYVVWEAITRQCSLCIGRTYLHGQAQNNEDPNRKYPCPHCFTGEETTFKKWVVKW